MPGRSWQMLVLHSLEVRRRVTCGCLVGVDPCPEFLNSIQSTSGDPNTRVRVHAYCTTSWATTHAHDFMGDEPPLEQYILHRGKWEPLGDGYYLMDMIMDGNPEISGPVNEVPRSTAARANQDQSPTVIIPTESRSHFSERLYC